MVSPELHGDCSQFPPSVIHILDRPDTTGAENARAQLGNRVAVVSPYAMQEYVAGSEKHGVTAATARERLTDFLGSGRAEPGGNMNPVTVAQLMAVNGLKYMDAAIVSSGMDQGLKTLTSDFKTMGRKVPHLLELYEAD